MSTVCCDLQVVSAPTGAGKTGVMVSAVAALAVLKGSADMLLGPSQALYHVQELAMLRLLSKHLNPTAPAAPPMGAPRPQQHFQSPNGSHKTIYLGMLLCTSIAESFPQVAVLDLQHASFAASQPAWNCLISSGAASKLIRSISN